MRMTRSAKCVKLAGRASPGSSKTAAVAALLIGLVGCLDEPRNPPAPGPEVARVQAKHAIGEQFSVGYWTYRCNSVNWQPFIASGFGSVERPDAAFLVLDLSVRNDDRTSSTLPPLKLIDPHGREFDESSKGVFLEGSFETLKQLNPGVSSRGLVVFDVPHGDYMLKVSGGILSGKDALVDLTGGSKQEASQEGPHPPPPTATAAAPNQNPPSSPGEVLGAAMRGNANAQYQLGTLYYLGKGVPKDYEEAYFWLSIAASGKVEGVRDEELRTDVDDTASHLTPAELARARDRVRSWLEQHPAKVQ